MNDDPMFGPSRRDPDGLTAVPGKIPAQVTEWMVESCAMHTRSTGWVPAVIVRFATDDGAGLVGTIPVGESLDEIIQTFREAAQAARRDVATALARGDIR